MQTLIAILLLAAAVAYVVYSVRKSMRTQHDCPDCGAGEVIQKNKKIRPSAKKA